MDFLNDLKIFLKGPSGPVYTDTTYMRRQKYIDCNNFGESSLCINKVDGTITVYTKHMLISDIQNCNAQLRMMETRQQLSKHNDLLDSLRYTFPIRQKITSYSGDEVDKTSK